MNNDMVSIFGKPGSSSDASGIMGSNALNSSSAPTNPQSQNPNEITNSFAYLVWLGYKIQELDKDPEDAEEIQNLLSFAERKYSVLALKEDEFTDLAPAASPPPPITSVAPPPQGGPPGTMGAPGQQPGQPTPPPPGAAPAANPLGGM